MPPGRVLADKAYRSRANRAYLAGAGSGAPSRKRLTRPATARTKAAPVAAHPPSALHCTSCATLWNAGSAAKRNRAVATRYDKLAVRYEATVHIAAINEWLPRHL